MRARVRQAFVTVVLMLTIGCRPAMPAPEVLASDPTTEPADALPAVDGRVQGLVDLALADLARQENVDADAIFVQSVEEANFADASLGVREPGQAYAQVVTPGAIIRLVVHGRAYRYHGSGDRVVLVPDAGASTGSAEGEAMVIPVFMGNARLNRAGDCAAVFPVMRQIPRTYDLPRAALEQLFAGPTEEEAQQGYVSSFARATAGALKSLAIEGETAYIDLVDIRPLMPAANTSCGQQAFFAEVETTLRNALRSAAYPVERVIYAIEGDPAAFYEWMQLGCSEANDHCDRSPFEEKVGGMAPEEVVASFYTWHLGTEGVLVSRAYRSNGHLSQAFVRKVDEIIASFSRGGYDPFLCAQDIPRDMRLDPVRVEGDEARVGVHGIWNPGTQYESANDILVVLQRQRGEWKIADIQCLGAETEDIDAQGTGVKDGLEAAQSDRIFAHSFDAEAALERIALRRSAR